LSECAAVDGGARTEGDAREGHDGALEVRGASERRTAADGPEDVARVGAADQDHVAGRRRDKRCAGLEDEDTVRVAETVEHQRARQRH